jgi:hypothetical protein
LFLAHTYSCTLDHVELEPEVQAEQARVEASTNLALD